tara:strand:- start:495 stop:1394 length:900 start_codon:yes stop_codon:yes gene_type:complete
MKKLFIFLFFLSFNSFSQIEIEETIKKKTNSIPYDGSFMKLPYIIKDEVGAGLIGEKVTLIDISTFDINNLDESSVSFSEGEKFKNKTFEIINYEKDLYPVFTIKNESGTFKWQVSSISEYVFNKFIDKIKEKLLNKTYTPLHNQSEIESLDGREIIIDGSKEYKITKVSFAKFSIEYGIRVELNNSFSVKYPAGEYDQPTYHNGERNVPSIGWINLSVNYSDITFIEKEIFKSFTTKNSDFISQIRDEVVKIGMTEQQCRWAWGMPSKGYGSLVGYDEVYDWGGKTLYFKKNKLALIK